MTILSLHPRGLRLPSSGATARAVLKYAAALKPATPVPRILSTLDRDTSWLVNLRLTAGAGYAPTGRPAAQAQQPARPAFKLSRRHHLCSPSTIMKGTANMVAHKQRQRDGRPGKKPVPLANSQSISQCHTRQPNYKLLRMAFGFLIHQSSFCLHRRLAE